MWAECYVQHKQSSSRNRSSSVEEGISQAQATGHLQIRDQRTVGSERRVVRGRAWRDLRAAWTERFGQIDADSDPFDAAHSRSWRSAIDGAQAPGRRERRALEDRARECRRRVLQETVGAREPALLGLSIRPRAEAGRETRVRNPRTAGHRVAAVFRPARRDEPGDAAEGLDRARVNDQSADAAARRADDGARPEEPPRRSAGP